MFDHMIYKITAAVIALIIIAKIIAPAITTTKNIFQKSRNITINYDERFDVN